MEVDQKHITTIRLHDAKGSEIRLGKDGTDYRLRLASSNNVVNITLGVQDIRKLWEQIIQLEIEENWKPAETAEGKSFIFNGKPRSFQETMAAVFTRMAQQVYESTNKA
jgi:hypothetical protein